MSIDLQALSITSAFNSIVSFFKSQENNSRWKDLTTGAEGVFLIRMLANVISNISYKMITARRENFLSTANLQSSNLGIALNLGYSAYRGSNQKRLIEFTPTGDYVLPKYTVMGTYNDNYSILNVDDIVLRKGVSQNIKTVIGNVNTISWTAGTTKTQPFTRYESGISEDYVLLLDGTEVPTSDIVRDLDNDMYLVRTNPYASVDVLYLNNKATNSYRYGTESVFTLKYVELADVTTIDYTSEMFAFGNLTNTLTIESYIPFETNASIKVNAPLEHEVQHLIRSKKDYTERVKQLVPNVVQTSYTSITPTYTLISYLKDDYTTIKPTEIINMMTVLDEENYFGTPLPDITAPRREVANLKIELSITDRLMDANDIRSDIDNIITNNYSILLNQTLDTFNFERLIEGLSYVKWARVTQQTPEWKASATKALGSIVENDGLYYKANKIIGSTGTTEPTWDIPQGLAPIGIGTETYASDGTIIYRDTIDGDIVWRTYKRLDVENIEPWEAQTYHKIGDYVYTSTYPEYMFKCIDLSKTTGASIPDVSSVEIGDFITDGGIVWVCKEYSDSYSTRVSSTEYRLGDSANISSKSFEVISYVGNTGYTTPDFEKTSYPVYNYTIDSTTGVRTAFLLEGNKAYYFKAGDTIKAEYLNASNTIETTTFKVKGSVGSVSATSITVEQDIPSNINYTNLIPLSRGTQDGDIFWEVVDDTTSITYDWNVYNTIYYDLEIK